MSVKSVFAANLHTPRILSRWLLLSRLVRGIARLTEPRRVTIPLGV